MLHAHRAHVAQRSALCSGWLRNPSSYLSTAATSRKTLEVATPSDFKGGALKPSIDEGTLVKVVERKISWKPLKTSSKLTFPVNNLFCQSNDPLQHTADDIGKYFQLDGSTTAFSDVFYHTGFCGNGKEFERLRTAAIMVREPLLSMRDEVLGLHKNGGLNSTPGFIINGKQGYGKSYTLNYVIAACQQADWLVVNIPRAYDWSLGLCAKSTQFPNEAYRVTDENYFKDIPAQIREDVSLSKLYESPIASTNLLVSTYLSQKSKLEKIRLKDAERIAHYAPLAQDASAPTLADVLRSATLDRDDGFTDFPIALRPIFDFLEELKAVTEMPVLVAIDGFNYWQHISNAKEWGTTVALHSQQMLVPKILGNIMQYGDSLQNGVMLAGISLGGPSRPGLPRALRSRWMPPIDWRKPVFEGKRESLGPLVRNVPAYTAHEVQRCLEFYAFTGHLNNAGLQEQLRTGELRRKIALLCASAPAELFKVCDLM